MHAANLLFFAHSLARPGGGDLFDGGAFDGGGGSGGGDVDIGLVIDLVILCVRYPALGAVVVTGLGVYYVVKRVRGSGLPDWSAGVPRAEVPAARSAVVARAALDRLRGFDQDFSVVLFEDFLYTLYAELQHARPRGGLARLAPFLSPQATASLTRDAPEVVSGVIVGALRLVALAMTPDRVELTAEFEANLSETASGASARRYVVDRLRLSRALGARSRPPARARKLDCPNCGAPLEGLRGTTCGYCRTEVGGGRLDWQVQSFERVRSDARPNLFSKTVAERGNELPTRVDPGAEGRLAKLRERDPAFELPALHQRVNLIFHELGAGWTARDLPRIRPYVSDNLFAYFGYFVDLYLAERARNVTENARIVHIELANLLSDQYFDAVTLRVFATGLDYTLADDGRLLTGSRERERPYSEYWTLIRGRFTRGRARAEPACPQCGAPLKVGMGGNCEFCRARIVTGEFDWVLSRIEQDEAYAG